MSLASGFEGGTGRNAVHAGLESGRVGRDSCGSPARTFHCNFSSVKLGGGTTALAALDYALRERENERDAGDVEAAAGDKQRVLEAAAKIEDTARVRTGPTAERILVKQTFELPADSTPEQRARCAQAFVEDWRRRGHEAVAAVHVHGEEQPQPHLHVLATARPLNPDGTVNRESSLRPFANKGAVRRERAIVADLVNEHCAPAAHFHPGKLADTGIERAAKKRIPQGAFRTARKQIRAEPEKAAAIEAEMCAESRAERAPLHEARYAAWRERAPKIEAKKAAGGWPPPSQRARLQKWGDFWYDQSEIVERTSQRRREERDEQRARAEKAEGERDGLQDRVRALEELNKTQTKYVTDWHTDHKEELPDLATVEGQSAAWANMRAWKAAELKKAEDAVAAKEAAEEALEDERARADRAEMIAAATRVAGEHTRAELQAGAATLKAEKQAAGADAAKPEKEKIEAQPVPDLPAAWTLPVDELIKAGDVVARKAEVTWGAADSSPTAMPLDGIAGSPVLTFTPEHGLLRKKPATWRYEDAGRYAGKAAIEIEQPDITDRNLDWPDWRAAGEALSRALVTDALEDGAETPRWLEQQFPDLDAEYGPKIRTREYHGENPRTYVGEMSGGQPHGAGTTTWKSGDRYQGQFENGLRQGQGVYDYPNGNRYEGAWQEGEMSGQGVMTYVDGGRYEGSWKAGKQHGAGIVISPSGEITEGVWEDGKRVEAAAKETQTRSRGRGGVEM